jgi:hypothetical protein
MKGRCWEQDDQEKEGRRKERREGGKEEVGKEAAPIFNRALPSLSLPSTRPFSLFIPSEPPLQRRHQQKQLQKSLVLLLLQLLCPLLLQNS